MRRGYHLRWWSLRNEQGWYMANDVPMGYVDNPQTQEMYGPKGRQAEITPHVGSTHARCCNCGLVIGEHRDVHIFNSGWYAVCSEGCAIQIVVRGKCSTNSYHPWHLPEVEQERQYPELAVIRDRIRRQT